MYYRSPPSTSHTMRRWSSYRCDREAHASSPSWQWFVAWRPTVEVNWCRKVRRVAQSIIGRHSNLGNTRSHRRQKRRTEPKLMYHVAWSTVLTIATNRGLKPYGRVSYPREVWSCDAIYYRTPFWTTLSSCFRLKCSFYRTQGCLLQCQQQIGHRYMYFFLLASCGSTLAHSMWYKHR